MKKNILFISIMAFLIISCKRDKINFDASGSFETEEVIISSEATGIIRQFDLEEGQVLTESQFIGYVDTVQLYLKKKQLESQIDALLVKKPDISAQLASLEEQLKAARIEQKRISNLVKADAATPKQLDDANAQVLVLEKQIAAQKSSLGITSSAYTKEATPFLVQIEQINDQLAKSRIVNPMNGTVIAKYAEANEMATPGKPLYKIADLSHLLLRAYITGNQLPQVTLNQKVIVMTDNGAGQFNNTEGTIIWISDKAEFTPKTIQTKEERANMVYAIKVKVQNEGSLKIGMYGELKFGS